ncbi:MAG: methyltransferase, TIGR04325 family [Candidatus Electrothrix sp. AW3_4]|nr:methyltransferase, TIGR04325 family [Candidatus Electrothrix gigas]
MDFSCLTKIVPFFSRRFNSPSACCFYGDYSSWEDALSVSSGYDVSTIIEQVREASRKVKRGEAAFERDSVCFYHEEYRWPALGCLFTVAAANRGMLRVMDFGGSLGSFYFQHRRFFNRIKKLRWTVVEQQHFVELGHAEFQDEKLFFSRSISECIKAGAVDVAFLSSVLPYVEKPHELLYKIGKKRIPYIIIDRTPFIDSLTDRLTVQNVPESIYKASYPAWFFSSSRFEEVIHQSGYKIITEFPGFDDVGIGKYKGLFLELDC